MPPAITVYHNARCSKSRAAAAALDAGGVPYELVEYLKDPPSADRLRSLIDRSDHEPADFVRTKETDARSLNPSAMGSSAAVANFVAKHPRVLQRPILASDERVVIARDPETVQAFIDAL